jgi:hypothetical protein
MNILRRQDQKQQSCVLWEKEKKLKKSNLNTPETFTDLATDSFVSNQPIGQITVKIFCFALVADSSSP